MNKVNKKIRHLIRHFNFKKEELCEIRKMYAGEEFNPNDEAYIKLLSLSQDLCKRYTEVCKDEIAARRKNKKLKISVFTYLKFYFKKLHLLKLLMPVHGFVLYAEQNIEAVIGLVDCKGYGFINRNVSFSPNSLVKIEKGNVFALKINVGYSQMKIKDGKVKLDEIFFDKNCWICAGSKISGDIKIGKESVIGAGAHLSQDLTENSLAVGRPCKMIKKIDKSYEKNSKPLRIFSEEQKEKIRQHIKKVNFGKYPKEFEKMICGQEFNTMSKQLTFLYNLTKSLCDELSEDISSQRKKEILDILFVKDGDCEIEVGKNFYIDMLGTAVVKGKVTVGENVALGGNVLLENGTVIGDDSILFESGHSVFANKRMMKFSLKKGFYEDTQYDGVIVKGSRVGKNVVVAPNSVIDKNLPDDVLYVKGKIV